MQKFIRIGHTVKTLLLIFFAVFGSACERSSNNYQGVWQLKLKLAQAELPFEIQLIQKNDQVNGTLFNSTEEIPLTGFLKEGTLKLDIGSHYSHLNLKLEGDTINGQWVRSNKKNYTVPIVGERVAERSLFKSEESFRNKLNLPGKWRVQLSEEKQGLGIFSQTGSIARGSILTTTGDYRYLEGPIKGEKVKLYGFDGVFAFVIDLKVDKETFAGTMHAGKDYQSKISGARDKSFALEDANFMTKLIRDTPIELNIKSLSGEVIDLKSSKVKIIQLFGSWCPNCIDETMFILDWKKQYPGLAKDIEFYALAFENFDSKSKALKALKKVKAKLAMNYPIALVDYNKSVKPEDILPIDKIRAFPTMLYLDGNNRVIKVHTGFSGQATGPFFEKFVEDFTQTVSALILKQAQ